ncbi:MAG: hypothetical protein ICV79_05295 [Flavisolibacter sp.]|nr:hypothetical protein [Flavisolibacter sp.]
MNQSLPIPGHPKTPEPAKLVSIAAAVQHTAIVRTGVTTTQKGSDFIWWS